MEGRRSRLFIVALIAVATLLSQTDATFAKGGHSSSKSSSNSKSSKSSSNNKSVYVGGYTTKKGTYVAPHRRAAPGEGKSYSSSEGHKSKGKHSGSTHKAAGVKRDQHGKIARSEKAKDSFRKNHPCPSTGRTSGACPGYVIDHIRPLKRGGADDPSNMQWQTKSDAKEKDKRE